ncbi:hypothetical protein ACVHNB_38655 [Streptomyces sp. YJ-C3]
MAVLSVAGGAAQSQIRDIHAATDDAGWQRSTRDAGWQTPGTNVLADGVAPRQSDDAGWQ